MKIWMIISSVLVLVIGVVYALEGLNAGNLDVKAVALLAFGAVNAVLTVTKK